MQHDSNTMDDCLQSFVQSAWMNNVAMNELLRTTFSHWIFMANN